MLKIIIKRVIIENTSDRNSRIYWISLSKKATRSWNEVVGLDNINDSYDVN